MNTIKYTLSKLLNIALLIIATSIILIQGKTLFLPLLFGLLIAIVMYPICKWFEKKGFTKVISIVLCLFIVTILIASIVLLVIWQMKMFINDAPSIVAGLSKFVINIDLWINTKLGVNIDLKNSFFQSNNSNTFSSFILNTTDTLFLLFITPVFTALLMYHRSLFVTVLKLVTPNQYLQKLELILKQVIHTYFNYIKGMILVYIIVGILNTIGLYALGVNNALLYGMLCAIMTIIPYIGIFISALLPISIIWVQTNNIWYPIGVVAVFSFVQYLEANVIFPKVVGTQLNVSTFAMLVAIIVGGIIWGVSGMILFIPFIAILKIISDHFEEWKPLNLLLSR